MSFLANFKVSAEISADAPDQCATRRNAAPLTILGDMPEMALTP
jgi:hypothetical protein